MPMVDVFIDSKHDGLRRSLIPEVFEFGWQLLAFAAGIGWQVKKRLDPPARGFTVKVPSDGSQRGDALLADIIAVLEIESSESETNGENADDGRIQIRKLNADSFSERCRDLNAYAHGGFDYMETVKNAKGCSYREVVVELAASPPDPSVLDPLGSI